MGLTSIGNIQAKAPALEIMSVPKQVLRAIIPLTGRINAVVETTTHIRG